MARRTTRVSRWHVSCSPQRSRGDCAKTISRTSAAINSDHTRGRANLQNDRLLVPVYVSTDAKITLFDRRFHSDSYLCRNHANFSRARNRRARYQSHIHRCSQVEIFGHVCRKYIKHTSNETLYSNFDFPDLRRDNHIRLMLIGINKKAI